VSAGSYDVLITGDMNAEVENRLIKYNDLPDIELLVAGHHGSRYSTGDTLLDELRPESAVISVGEGNSYGHPAEETLERLAKRNITIYRTDLTGTVVLHTSGKE
jgi:competence protein ComEC